MFSEHLHIALMPAVALVNLLLGLLAFYKSPNREAAKAFLPLTICLSVWTLCHAMARVSMDLDHALFWTRAIMLGPIFIPYVFLEYVDCFVPGHHNGSRWVKFSHALFVGVCLLSLPTPLLIRSVSFAPWGIQYVGGPVFLLYSIYFSLGMAWGISLMIRRYRHVIGLQRAQLFYMLIGFTGSILIGLIATVALPLMGYGQWNKFGPIGTLSIVGLFSYSIIKHRLMDINLIIRKTLVYSTVVGVLTALYLGVILIVAHLFEGLAGDQTVFSSAVAAVLVSFCFQPLKSRVQHFVDSKFFRQYVDREEKLYELSREVITHTTPEAMGGALMHVIEDALHPKCGALFLRSREGNGFVRVSGIGETELPLRMDDENELAKYCKDHPQPFVQDGSEDVGKSRSTRLKDDREDAA